MLGRIIKGIGILLSFCIGLIIFLLSLNSLMVPLTSGAYEVSKVEDSLYDIKHNDSTLSKLRFQYGFNKTIPKNIELQALVALSFFPELNRSSIEFIEAEALFPLQSRPALASLLSFNLRRQYYIVISKQSLKEYEAILLKNIPFKGKVGVLGHELSHIAYYETVPSLIIAGIALQYLISFSFRKRFERRTDEITIDHGMGNYLLSWRLYFEDFIDKKGPLQQKFYFENRYLNAKEIRLKMRKSLKQKEAHNKPL